MKPPQNRKMRGIFVCSTFPTPANPTFGLVNGLHVQALSRYLDIKVLSPHPYFPSWKHSAIGRSKSSRNYENIAVTDTRALYLPLSRGAINGIIYGWSIRHSLRRLCEEFHPDFLMTSFGFPDAVGVAEVAPALGLPLVAILRGTDIHTYCQMPARWPAIVKALNSAALVIPISRSLADIVIQSGVDSKCVHVVHYGIDQHTFQIRDRNQAAQELGLPIDRKRILFVGNLLPVKALPTLIAAFAGLVGNDDVDLYLIGEGPEQRPIKKLIAKHHLDGRVRLLGEKLHAEVAHWMAACDLVCLPSQNEGIPNVVLEAFASGRPVVASRVGGIPEVVDDGTTGLLVPPGNVSALTNALQEALVRRWDPVLIRGTVRDFDWDVNARSLTALVANTMTELL